MNTQRKGAQKHTLIRKLRSSIDLRPNVAKKTNRKMAKTPERLRFPFDFPSFPCNPVMKLCPLNSFGLYCTIIYREKQRFL